MSVRPPSSACAGCSTSRRRLLLRQSRVGKAVPEPIAPMPEQGTDVADAALQAGTEQAAELVAAVTNGDAAVARDAPRVVHAVIEASGVAGTSEPADAATAPPAGTAELPQAQVIALDVGAQSSFGRVLGDLLREQAVADAEAAAALAQASSPSDVLRMQGEYLRQTLERMSISTAAGLSWRRRRGRSNPQADRLQGHASGRRTTALRSARARGVGAGDGTQHRAAVLPVRGRRPAARAAKQTVDGMIQGEVR